MRWFTWKRAIFAALMVVVVIVGFNWFRNKNKGPEYQLINPSRKEISEVLSVSGRVEAEKKAVLKFPATGKLNYLGVTEAEEVKRGRLLANMDVGDLQSAATEAYYRYQAADANAKEVEDQVKGHAGDETFAQKNDRVTAQALRDIAYDNWLEARRALTNGYLYAPFAGVVSSISVKSVGATVSITDGVTVVDPASLYFLTEVDETDLGKIVAGQQVTIDLDAFAENIVGQVASIGYETMLSDTGATVLPVKVTLPVEWLTKLRLGLNGDADILIQTVPDALVLPIEAVKGDEVTLANGEKRKVEVGIMTDTDIQVTQGLSETDQVRLDQ